jgi:hypothetical protein
MTRFVVADRVGVIAVDDDIYVAHLPDGPILALSGTAAMIWHVALDGDAEGISDRVAAAVGLLPAVIAPDVDGFIDDLVTQGLLVSS